MSFRDSLLYLDNAQSPFKRLKGVTEIGGLCQI